MEHSPLNLDEPTLPKGGIFSVVHVGYLINSNDEGVSRMAANPAVLERQNSCSMFLVLWNVVTWSRFQRPLLVFDELA